MRPLWQPPVPFPDYLSGRRIALFPPQVPCVDRFFYNHMSAYSRLLLSIRFAFLPTLCLAGWAAASSTLVANNLENTASGPALNRIAFGSCAHQGRPQPVWQHVIENSPDLWIWAGDNIYADTEDAALYLEKFSLLDAQPGYQKLRQSTSHILATWDDHDYGVNDGGREFPMKAEFQKLFLDFFEVPPEDPRRSREGIYGSRLYGSQGQRLQVILLDTRYHRSPLARSEIPHPDFGNYLPYLPIDSSDSTMLGEAQWHWLEETLKQPADLRLIVSSIQFIAEQHPFEKWANLPRERQRMLELIRRTRANGVVFLSGDRHHAELSRLHLPGLYPIYDLTSSGINQSHRRKDSTRPPEANSHRLGDIHHGHHFGMLNIDWQSPSPSLSLSIIDDQGKPAIFHRIALDTLRF